MNNYAVPSGIDRMGYVPIGSIYAYSSTRACQPTSIPLSLSTRNSSSSEYGLHYDSDSPVDNYGLQTTSLSAHHSYGEMYPIQQDSGRNYTHVGHRLPPSYSAYGDQETSPTYSGSPISYAAPVSSRSSLGGIDSASSSFNVVSLQYSLPNAAPDRVLPNPMPTSTARPRYSTTSSINSTNSRANALEASGTSHHSLPLMYSSKPHSSCITETAASESRSNSIPSVGSIDPIGPPPSKVSTATASSTTSESSPSNYVPSGTPEASPSNAVSSSYSSSSAYSSASTSISTVSLVGPSSSCIVQAPSSSSSAPKNNNVILACQNSQANLNLYSYSSDTTTRNSTDERPNKYQSTLVSNVIYTPLVQPQPDRVANINNFHTDTLRTRQAVLHRSSRQSINQSS
jgi:hypothetical protein